MVYLIWFLIFYIFFLMFIQNYQISPIFDQQNIYMFEIMTVEVKLNIIQF